MVQDWDDYEDEELVAEVLLGQPAAFDVLVARYRPAVLAAILRQVPSRAVAEDICQEALLRAFRALSHLRDPSRFAAWLHAIARREVIRHGPGESRAAGHSPLDEQTTQTREAPGQTGWEAVERQEEGEWVRQAMSSLPEEYQLVLTLRYWAEMPLEQIARFLDRPLSTVKWRLHHARALMRQRLTTSRTEIPDPDWRNSDDTATGRQHHRNPPHRADAGPDRGDGPRCRVDRQPGRAEHGSSPQLQHDRAAPDRHGAGAGRSVRAAA